MEAKRLLRTLIILTILSSTISCDQISKNIVRQRMNYNEQIGFINNYLTITKIENTGAFLSVGNSLPQPLKLILLTIIPLIVLGLVLTYLLTSKSLSNITILGICFVVGGGVGNIYDRLMYGSVTDFLHIDFILFQTGIFNMADVSIMVGMVMIIIESYLGRLTIKHTVLDKHGDE